MCDVIAVELALAYVVIVFFVGPRRFRGEGGIGFVPRARRAPHEGTADVLLVIGFVALVAPALGHFSTVAAAAVARAVVGVAIFACAVALALAAQREMGPAWRTGVDAAAPASLVTGGPFRFVRNPVYSSMLLFAAAMLVLVPSVSAATGSLVVLAGLEVQSRLVEEPHLEAVHGEPYVELLRSVGRFVPGVGRRRS